MTSMAELIAAHCETDELRCHAAGCGHTYPPYFEFFDDEDGMVSVVDDRVRAVSNHVAEVLAAAGYGKLTLVQLAERDRPESMRAARAEIRAEGRAAQAERTRRAQEIAWAKGATSAGMNLMALQAAGINPNPYRRPE